MKTFRIFTKELAEARAPYDNGYIVWGWVIPSGKFVEGITQDIFNEFGTATHGDLARKLGYKNQIEAERKGCARFGIMRAGNELFISVQGKDTPSAVIKTCKELAVKYKSQWKQAIINSKYELTMRGQEFKTLEDVFDKLDSYN